MTRFGTFEFDAGRRQLLHAGRDVHLTPKAFELLGLLVEAAPRVVPKPELHARLWPRGAVSDATLVGLVKEIRRALAACEPQTELIRTAHRIGYALDVAAGAPPKSAACWLVVAGERMKLGAGENVVGRDADAQVQLDHATVSRHHARITVGESGAILEDVGSKNGTRVGDSLVRGAVTLRNGDRITFGQIAVTFRQSAPSLPTATQLSRAGVEAPGIER